MSLKQFQTFYWPTLHRIILGLIEAGLTPHVFKEYCKKLIDVAGKDGGFILDGATGIPDEARVENVRAMAEITREYGVYRANTYTSTHDA